jgi:hypothetical protein
LSAAVIWAVVSFAGRRAADAAPAGRSANRAEAIENPNKTMATSNAPGRGGSSGRLRPACP